MNKTFKFYGFILAIVLAMLSILELGKREVVDWRKSLDVDKKTPFGLFVFDREVKNLLPQLKKQKETPYVFYSDSTKRTKHNILLINPDLDSESWFKILKQVEQGNDALVIAYDFMAKDSIGIEMENHFLRPEQNVFLRFTDEKIQHDSLRLDKMATGIFFRKIPKQSEILGYGFYKDESTEQMGNYTNFIKIKKGKGNLYLHSEPLFLTNYYLLKEPNTRYWKDVLSYLPNRPTYWFAVEKDQKISLSPLRFVLANPPLKYAWWLFLVGMIIFMIFNAKRKQRIVPVIEPLRNKSVEFVKSVGNLYLQEGDFHDMMAKKAQYFLYKVRTQLLINTQILDEHFEQKLQIKTGQSMQEIKEVMELIKKGLDPYSFVNQDDLVKMNSLIDKIIK